MIHASAVASVWKLNAWLAKLPHQHLKLLQKLLKQ